MENEALHIRYLIGIAAILCAVIIGYNLFFVPDAAMTTVVYTDCSSTIENAKSADGYTPSQGKTALNSTAQKVNINTATVQELADNLPQIGTVIAQRIVDYREKNGSFKSVQDIKNVSGIGDKTFEKIQDYITVN